MGYKFDAVNHVHTLNDWPLIGTSTVGNVLAKPLTWWAAGLALRDLGWTKQRDDKQKYIPKGVRLEAATKRFQEIKQLDAVEYLNLLDACYRAHDREKKESAEAGTDRHAIVEKFVKMEMGHDISLTSEEIAQIQSFISWSKANVKRYLWSELNCYSEKHWIGGISDIGCELNDGRFAIIDIKSSKDAYASQFFQCGGYDLAITENGGFDSDGNQTMPKLEKPIEAHIIFPFGMKEPTGIESKTTPEENRRAFLAELFLHKALQRFEKE